MKEKLLISIKKLPINVAALFVIISALLLLPDKVRSIAQCVMTSYDSFDDVSIKLIDATNFIIKYLPNSHFNQILGVIFLFLFIFIILLKIFYRKDELLILKISSLKTSSTNILINNQEKKKINIIELDFIDEMQSANPMQDGFEEIVKKYIKTLDQNAISLRRKVRDSNFGLIGILHTPFALRVGYIIGDGREAILLHKNRNDDFYSNLSNSTTYPSLKVSCNLVDNSDELIVAISTSFPITDDSLDQFKINNRNSMKFELESSMGFDSISSSHQCFEYRKQILNDIREIVRENKIHTIHMVLATSVCFTYYLGQGLNKQYDPKIICYNFSERKYNWGISIFDEPDNCIQVFDFSDIQ